MSTSTLHGFPLDYLGPSEIDPRLICQLCDNPFIDPHSPTTCKHNFCLTCIKHHCKRVAKSCPKCSQPITELRPSSSSLVRAIEGLKIRCPHREAGCKETFPRRDLLDHINRDCGFSTRESKKLAMECKSDTSSQISGSDSSSASPHTKRNGELSSSLKSSSTGISSVHFYDSQTPEDSSAAGRIEIMRNKLARLTKVHEAAKQRVEENKGVISRLESEVKSSRRSYESRRNVKAGLKADLAAKKLYQDGNTTPSPSRSTPSSQLGPTATFDGRSSRGLANSRNSSSGSLQWDSKRIETGKPQSPLHSRHKSGGGSNSRSKEGSASMGSGSKSHSHSTGQQRR